MLELFLFCLFQILKQNKIEFVAGDFFVDSKDRKNNQLQFLNKKIIFLLFFFFFSFSGNKKKIKRIIFFFQFISLSFENLETEYVCFQIISWRGSMRNCKEDFFVGKLNSNEKQKTYFFDNKKLMKYFEFFSKMFFFFPISLNLEKRKIVFFFWKKIVIWLILPVVICLS